MRRAVRISVSSIVGTIAVVTALVVAGPASADPPPTATPTASSTTGTGTGTGTLTVMLMTPQKTRIDRAGIEITLGTAADPEEWFGQTDAAGEATFEDVPAASDYVVHGYDVYPDGWDTRIGGTRWQVAVQPGVHSWVVSVAREGAVERGSVLAPDGSPINLAKVAIHDDWNNREYDTWTNAAGRYQMIALPTTQITITVTQRGYAPDVFTTEVHAEYGSNSRTLGAHDVTLHPVG